MLWLFGCCRGRATMQNTVKSTGHQPPESCKLIAQWDNSGTGGRLQTPTRMSPSYLHVWLQVVLQHWRCSLTVQALRVLGMCNTV
jgi:hypothetical protein